MKIFDYFSIVLIALYAAWTVTLMNVAIKSAWENIRRADNISTKK